MVLACTVATAYTELKQCYTVIAWAINAVLVLVYEIVLTFLMVSEAVMNLAWFSYTRCCISLSSCLTSGIRTVSGTTCGQRDTHRPAPLRLPLTLHAYLSLHHSMKWLHHISKPLHHCCITSHLYKTAIYPAEYSGTSL